jgi:hypothetical protein
VPIASHDLVWADWVYPADARGQYLAHPV